MTKHKTTAYRAGAAGFALAIASLAAPAFAQDAAPADAATADDSTPIIVTGTRIERPDLTASSPVSVISSESIKSVNTVTVEQILSVNPQFAGGSTGASNNPGDGSATLDLRGLGSQRTLVLLNGKRLPLYDTTGSVDVNQIPTILLKDVQVLTGGASAVYGSDAIAGVVNFVLDDKFTGFKVDGGSQITGHGDGAFYDGSIAAGFNLGDRGHIVIAGNYSQRDGVKYGARSFSNSVLCSDDNVSFCGSSNTTPTAFDIPGAGRQQITANGTLTSNVVGYNYNPVNYAQLPFQRWGGTALFNYNITDGVELYGWGSYQHTKVITTLAPTATAGFSFNIDPTNPLLTAAERDAFFNTAANPDLVINSDGTSTVGIRRRITETGGRIEEHRSDTWQVLAGLRGDLGSSLKWDASVQYAEVHKHQILRNDLSYTALTEALDVIADANGNAICRSASARANGCLPLNVFTVGTLPQNALSYVLRNATQDNKTSQFVAEASISGDLGFLTSPLANKPAAFSIGADYRRETADTDVDDAYASGDLIYYGQGFDIRNKSYNVKEAYVEFKMPLVQEKPLFQALDVEAGYRISDYSTSGRVSSYKFGGDWAPVQGLKFRANFQHSVRAPNLYELYLPITPGTGSLGTDPCAGANVDATTAAICVAQGAKQSQIGSIPQPIAGQVNAFFGGNPDLKAEKSNTFTVGAVVEPVRGLSLTVDYYNIKIKDAIYTATISQIISQCFDTDRNASSAACSSIKRNPLDGSLSGNITYGVPSTYANIGSIVARGIDVGFAYAHGPRAGFHYSFTFNGTYQIKNNNEINGVLTECAGKFGADCDNPTPKWKHVATLGFGFQKVDFTTRWRLIGASTEDASTDILTSRIPVVNYFDETVNIRATDKFTFTLGVLNVFNKTPPIVGDTSGATSVAGSTFPVIYDILGRSFFARVTANF
ncbi:TonB-dependent receptor [Novosphingobium sp. SG720]|uniref:TonB-dependent receptor domain-containing protein n=1 Tax=Novosphingobium sp. SG720 TaxID=2586998 RepID=UPI0014456BF1|nr:outer membrane receptor protein involved in Fe transport [Novosphingobium sp. SG720]